MMLDPVHLNRIVGMGVGAPLGAALYGLMYLYFYKPPHDHNVDDCVDCDHIQILGRMQGHQDLEFRQPPVGPQVAALQQRLAIYEKVLDSLHVEVK